MIVIMKCLLYEEFEGDESIADDESEEITEDIDDDQCLQILEEIMKEDHLLIIKFKKGQLTIINLN